MRPSSLITITGRFGNQPFRKVRAARRRRATREQCSACNLFFPRGAPPHFCYVAYRGALRRYISNLQQRMVDGLLSAEE